LLLLACGLTVESINEQDAVSFDAEILYWENAL